MTREEKGLIRQLWKVYYFGFFQGLGIAKNEQDEYYFRDLLRGMASKTEEEIDKDLKRLSERVVEIRRKNKEVMEELKRSMNS